jgi:acyl carrier protein
MGSHQQSAPTIDGVRDAIRRFIVANFLFGADSERLTDATSFLESGIVDSTGILELIQFIEKTWSIRVDDSEMVPECLDSLDNISAFVVRKANGT